MHFEGVHPHCEPLGSHSQTAFSPQTSTPSPLLQIFVQKVAVLSPLSVAQIVASLLPRQSAKPVQYLPTPFELPVSPGLPQFAEPSPPESPPASPLEPLLPLDPLEPLLPLDPLEPLLPLEPLEPLLPLDPLEPLEPPSLVPPPVLLLEPLQEARTAIHDTPTKARMLIDRMGVALARHRAERE
jgi:hypothetical protein